MESDARDAWEEARDSHKKAAEGIDSSKKKKLSPLGPETLIGYWVFFTGFCFYRTAESFTTPYWIVPSFTGFPCVELCCSGSWLSFIGFIFGFTGFYRVLLSSTAFYWDDIEFDLVFLGYWAWNWGWPKLNCFREFYWVSPSFTEFYWVYWSFP